MAVGLALVERLAANEREAVLAEERHEHYCRQSLRDPGGKAPRRARPAEGELRGAHPI